MKRILAIGCVLLVSGVFILTSCASTSVQAPAPSASASPTSHAPAAQVPTTKPSAEKPQYGGTFTGSMLVDIRTFDIISNFGGDGVNDLTNERLIDGDWTKGPAGGYGTSAVLWDGMINLPQDKTGYLATKWNYTVNADNDTVTAVFEIRQGVHWALNPDSPASLLVNGREVTADDVAWNLTDRMDDSKSMFYGFDPQEKGLKATKTGPWEVSVTIPAEGATSTLTRLIDNSPIIPPEVYQKYGSQDDWRNNVGTGPFILSDYVSGSEIDLKRNPNYWMTDPIGPGKGNQLPYLDGVNWLIIPDMSTQEAAIRTAKIDWISGLSLDDATQVKQQVPALKEGTLQAGPGSVGVLYMRTDKAPFNDVRVRQALEMAIDWQSMNKSLYGGLGQIITFPYWEVKGYEPLYMDINSPDLPAADKQLFTYHPDQAKQLLTEAGYPNGFDTKLLTTDITANLDYYSVIKEYWSKIGVNLSLDPMDPNTLYKYDSTEDYTQMISDGQSPPCTYPEQMQFTEPTWVNLSLVNDPKANEQAQKARDAYLSGDLNGAFQITRSLLPYLIGQAYAIGPIASSTYDFWWPWVKNYDGEVCVGYINVDAFPRWIWIDQALKKTMGH